MVIEEKGKTQEIKEKEVSIPSFITVRDLAAKLSLSVNRVISELIRNGFMVTINEEIEYDIAAIIAEGFGFKAKKIKEEIAQKIKHEIVNGGGGGKIVDRAPVVAVMGHVDHGKTTLLDTLRKTKTAMGEAGGITQHIGAYQVSFKKKETGEEKLITFLDTPGHEAFYEMRRRGASATDIAVLVVAADDGVQPQTVQSIKFCEEFKVPMIVAINKIDKPEANPEKVKKELAEAGVLIEEWGGKVVAVEISAKKNIGIDKLLEIIILVSDMQEMKADLEAPTRGVIIESNLDSQRGPIATVLVQDGILNVGDYISAGLAYGRVKKMENFRREFVKQANPSMPVVVIGFVSLPEVGDILETSLNKNEAKFKTEKLLAKALKFKKKLEKETGEVLKFNIILKADTRGTLEAIMQMLGTIKSPEVRLEIIKMGVGDVNESDVKMAETSKSEIIAFESQIRTTAEELAEKLNVKINKYDVIYKLFEDVKFKMADKLPPEIIRHDIGKLKVIAVFKTGKMGANGIVDVVFGAKVNSGAVKNKSLLEIDRHGKTIGRGEILELQFNKKAVGEIKAGNNAGMHYRGNTKIEIGDNIAVYEEEKKKRKL